jgi:hypothetical protein
VKGRPMMSMNSDTGPALAAGSLPEITLMS